MAPVPNTFNHELVSSINGAQQGDKLYSVTEIASQDELPTGSIGTFIPEDRMSFSDMFMEMRMTVQEHTHELVNLREIIASQKELIKSQKRSIQRLNVQVLINQVVQLVFAVVHAKVLELVPWGKNIFEGISFKFTDIIKSDNVHSEKKNEMLGDDTYLQINSLMDEGFWYLVENRNTEAHPREINFGPIETIIDGILSDNTLDGDYLFCFELATSIFEELKLIQQVPKLIQFFNLYH